MISEIVGQILAKYSLQHCYSVEMVTDISPLVITPADLPLLFRWGVVDQLDEYTFVRPAVKFFNKVKIQK